MRLGHSVDESAMTLSRGGAVAALFSDLQRHPAEQSFGEATGLWTMYVSLLGRAVRTGADLTTLLQQFLKSMLGEPGGRRALTARDDYRQVHHAYRALRVSHPTWFATATSLLAERMEDAGALALADTTLAMLLQLELGGNALGVVERGRVIAHRARIARKSGDIVLAREQYETVRRLARQSRSKELAARASIGFAVLALLRGNLPESGRYFARAARVADETGLGELSRIAHNGCLIWAAKRDAFDEALAHGWVAFRYSTGNSELEAESLSNLGAVLQRMSHPRTALAAFDAALRRRPSARVAIPALGAAMLMSARLGQTARARQLLVDLVQRVGTADLSYSITDAFIDAAHAMYLIGERQEAERLRSRAIEMATGGEFHELEFRAAQLPEVNTVEAAVSELSHETRQICVEVEQLDDAGAAAMTGA